MVKLLRAEAFLVLILSLWAYFHLGFVWYWLLLILLPDVSMLGYLKNPKLGAIIYNLGHTYIFGLIILGIGIILSSKALLIISLIWIAHIAMDRMLGYGLKYPENFKHTHLGKIGE